MRCQFCGHDTRGPWPYCDETCEIDADLARMEGEDIPEEDADEWPELYQTEDEPDSREGYAYLP